MDTSQHRPFWKRKRWLAAAVLWLLLSYPLSIGPVVYVAARGWYLPGTEAEIAYWPVLKVLRNPLAYGDLALHYRAYTRWFEELSLEHRQ